jgi:hypothetical protein
MPQDHIGVIVFEIGNHSQPLYNIVSYNVYERLLGLEQTPWSERQLAIRLKNKKADTEARTKANEGQIPDTKPSHSLAEYAGAYENSAYGVMNIAMKNNQLQFDFHKMRLPMTHFHYDRFDTPDDEQDGKWSVNFRTNPQGDIDQAVMSLDEAEAVFTRRPHTIDPKLTAQMAGTYETPDGAKIQIVSAPGGGLSLVFPGQPVIPLRQVKGLSFRTPYFSDQIFEFVVQNGEVKALKQKDPSGEFTLPKR